MAVMRLWVSVRVSLADRIAAERPLLHGNEGGDELQAVGDAMVDLAQQHLGPLAGLAHLPLRGFLLPAQPFGRERLLGRRAQKVEEDPADILDDVVGGPGLQRRDGDPALIGPGDVDDGRRARTAFWISARTSRPSLPGMK